MLLSLVNFVKVINQREVVEHFAESSQCEGTILVMLNQIKVARDQDNIFHFELCVNKV